MWYELFPVPVLSPSLALLEFEFELGTRVSRAVQWQWTKNRNRRQGALELELEKRSMTRTRTRTPWGNESHACEGGGHPRSRTTGAGTAGPGGPRVAGGKEEGGSVGKGSSVSVLVLVEL